MLLGKAVRRAGLKGGDEGVAGRGGGGAPGLTRQRMHLRARVREQARRQLMQARRVARRHQLRQLRPQTLHRRGGMPLLQRLQPADRHKPRDIRRFPMQSCLIRAVYVPPLVQAGSLGKHTG